MTTTDRLQLEPTRTPAVCPPATLPRLSDSEAQQAAALLKALADPARLQILDVLGQRSERNGLDGLALDGLALDGLDSAVCVCELEGVVGLPDAATGQRPKQPTISHHLKVLRLAGLVEYEKRGQWAYYRVCRARLAAARRVLDMLRPGE